MAATYTLISSQVLGSSTSSVAFSSIPQTYTDLVLKFSTRSNGSFGVTSGFGIQFIFNSNTSSIYSATQLESTGTAASSGRVSSNSNIYTVWDNGASDTSNTFSNGELYMPNYASTTAKPMSVFNVAETNASGAGIEADAFLFNNTTGITNIYITDTYGGNFVQYSSFYLYGLKSS